MSQRLSSVSKEVEAYFFGYEQTLLKNSYKSQAEKLLTYYEGIKREFSEIILQTHRETYLENIQKTLTLDAKLQILFFFWFETDAHNCSEDEIISIAEKDCHTYYQETMDYKMSSTIPISFLQRIG
ncbi:hypothetical protein IGI37_002207 [Enterococcus sp. AZ194]|uniref:DUF7006 family protein n=1 Tax=Enterococcus sp. AZ194 TaxID=2774629 RepID=UPI003F23C238